MGRRVDHEGQIGMDKTGQTDSVVSGNAPTVESALSYVPNAIHLMRTTQQMQLQLSQMADQRASILMGGTFVPDHSGNACVAGGGSIDDGRHAPARRCWIAQA